MEKRISEEPLRLETLLGEAEDPSTGAWVAFQGTVRNENEGKPVIAVTYEAYLPLAEKRLRDLEKEVVLKFGVRSCRILHRIGRLRVGETSVVILVGSRHRKEAFEALMFAIEELKRKVPIWKKEHYKGGESQFVNGTPLKGEEKGR